MDMYKKNEREKKQKKKKRVKCWNDFYVFDEDIKYMLLTVKKNAFQNVYTDMLCSSVQLINVELCVWEKVCVSLDTSQEVCPPH